jgi:hypothetical protein
MTTPQQQLDWLVGCLFGWLVICLYSVNGLRLNLFFTMRFILIIRYFSFSVLNSVLNLIFLLIFITLFFSFLLFLKWVYFYYFLVHFLVYNHNRDTKDLPNNINPAVLTSFLSWYITHSRFRSICLVVAYTNSFTNHCYYYWLK